MQNVCQTFLLPCWAGLDKGTNSENSQTESLFRRNIVCWGIGCGFELVIGFDSGVEGLLGSLVGVLYWVSIQNCSPDCTPLCPWGCCWGLDIYYSLTGAGMRKVPLLLPLHVDLL